jgi:hypothetical protein
VGIAERACCRVVLFKMPADLPILLQAPTR